MRQCCANDRKGVCTCTREQPSTKLVDLPKNMEVTGNKRVACGGQGLGLTHEEMKNGRVENMGQIHREANHARPGKKGGEMGRDSRARKKKSLIVAGYAGRQAWTVPGSWPGRRFLSLFFCF